MKAEHYNYSRKDFMTEYDKHHPKSPKPSRDAFEFSLKRIEKLYKKDLQKIKLDYLFQLDDFFKKIKDSGASFNTIYNTMMAIGKIARIIDPNLATINNIKKVFKLLKEKRDTLALQQTKSVKESNDWIDHSKAIKILDEELNDYLFEPKTETDYRNFMLLNLMLRELPTRLGNFHNVNIIEDEPLDKIKDLSKDKNYIIANSDDDIYVFVFNKYKTAKYYGTITHLIDNPTNIELLKHYFETYDPITTFLCQSNNKALSQNAIGKGLSDISKKMFGKMLSVDMIRHIYITNFLKDNPKLKEKMILADLCGHSVETQNLYQRY
jgi:hypothetical protein